MFALSRSLQRRHTQVRPRRLIVEQLEDRTLLAAAPVPPGLVSWYRAEGDALDAADGNSGTLNGVTFAPGEVGQAFSFDGMDDEVQIPEAANLDLTNHFTIDFWMKPADLAGS